MMHELKVEIDNGRFTIGGVENFHVEAVDVFTGDDDYMETDRYSLTPDELNKTKLVVGHVMREGKVKSPGGFRVRHEPGVIMNLVSEDGNEYSLIISHHKGGLMIKAITYSYDEVMQFGDALLIGARG